MKNNIAGSLTYDTKLDTEGFEKGVDGLSSKAVALGNIMSEAFDKVASAMKDVIVQGVTYNAQIEQYQVALTTLTGSAKEADKIIAQIKKDAARTPFDVAGLTQANQLLISAGIESDRAREDILALGNAISATGGGNAELSRMAVNLQQIKNVGKASALDIKQFAYAGIDVYGLLADSMGITREEAAELDVTYEQLTDALRNAAEKGGKYYGAMEKQSKTLNGQISTLKDNFMTFAGNAAKPLFNFLKNIALPVLNDLLTGGQKFKETISGWIEVLSKFYEDNKTAIDLLAIALGTLTAAIVAYNAAMAISKAGGIVHLAQLALLQVQTWAYTAAQGAMTVATTIATAATSAFGAVMAFITSPITLVTLGIGALIAIIYLLIKNWEAVKETAKNVWNWIVNFFKGIPDAIGKAFSSIGKVGENLVKGLWNGIKNVKDWIMDKIKGFGNSIVGGIKKVFGIRSPSKVMRDEVGKFLPEGIAVGIDANTDSALDSIDRMNDEIMDKMHNAVNMETAKANFGGMSSSVTDILSANSVINVENHNVLELDGEKIYENQNNIQRNKNLQYGFKGGTVK